MKQGKIIVIEGACDGIGKTTQYEMLYKNLSEEGKVTTHHFPTYNSYQGKAIEKYLNGEYGNIKNLSPYFVNSIYAQDRAITWYTELKKQYDGGNIILLDRYTTSSLIYQSALLESEEEKKEFIDYVMDYEYKKLGIPKPDKVIFLNAPFELVAKLRNERKNNEGIKNDIHERNTEFMRKVYDNANFVAEYLLWDIIECSKDDKMKPKEEINKEIYKKIKKINK